LPEQENLWANIQCAKTPEERILYLKLLIAYDDEMPVPHSLLGAVYSDLNFYDKAISEFEKELEIYKNWNSKPRWSMGYAHLGYAYHKMGMYKKEKKLNKKAEKDFPDDPFLMYRQATLSLSEGKNKEANEYLEKYITIRKDNSATEPDIISSLAEIYFEADIRDTAEVYYRKAFSLQHNAAMMNNLAFFLIDNNRDVNEGLELVEEALGISPDNSNCLDTKAWGLFKLGNYEQAKQFIEKADSLKPSYNPRIFLHKQEIDKAIASQKNTDR
jgi:tetratricopeptide (TPR) repeat protein